MKVSLDSNLLLSVIAMVNKDQRGFSAEEVSAASCAREASPVGYST
jgi:hypothetical protein